MYSPESSDAFREKSCTVICHERLRYVKSFRCPCKSKICVYKSSTLVLPAYMLESTQPTDNSNGTDISSSFLQAQLELSVAQGVVNTCHGGPKLASLQKPWGGESRLLSRIRMFPLTGANLQLRVRSILQRVFLCCPFTRFDLGDLLKWSNRFKY